MPRNYFRESRKKIQVAFTNDIEAVFLKPLTNDSLPIEIIEAKNKSKDNTLKVVNIDGIPVSDDIRPISYILDVELTGKLFSAAHGFKTVEKVVLVLTKKTLYVVLIEMKSALDPSDISKIEEKIKHTIGRILLFLTHYIFDDKLFEDCEIQFTAVIFYNKDALTHHISLKKDLDIESLELTKIFQKKKNSYFVREPLGQEYKVRVEFQHSKSQNYDFNFNDLFKGDRNYMNAIVDDRTLPSEV
jgi:hypothetical protein